MKKIWKLLNGKKRTIAEIYWGIWIPVTQLSTISLSPNVVKWTAIVGILLTYFGLGHAAAKRYISGTEGLGGN